MAASPDPILDARGVEIESGDTCIWGFGVSRSIAMAEGVVLGEAGHLRMDGATPYCACGHNYPCPESVSLTPSGRVRVRVVRRSYTDGVKPVVDVQADRMVVLKFAANVGRPYLPTSPRPTQDEEARASILERIDRHKQMLNRTVAPSYWTGSLEGYHAFHEHELKAQRAALKRLDEV